MAAVGNRSASLSYTIRPKKEPKVRPGTATTTKSSSTHKAPPSDAPKKKNQQEEEDGVTTAADDWCFYLASAQFSALASSSSSSSGGTGNKENNNTGEATGGYSTSLSSHDVDWMESLMESAHSQFLGEAPLMKTVLDDITTSSSIPINSTNTSKVSAREARSTTNVNQCAAAEALELISGEWAAATNLWSEQFSKQQNVQQERTVAEREAARKRHREEREKYEAKMQRFHEEQRKAAAERARKEREAEEEEAAALLSKEQSTGHQSSTRANSTNATYAPTARQKARNDAIDALLAEEENRDNRSKKTRRGSAATEVGLGVGDGGGATTATPAIGISELEEVSKSSLPSTAYIAYLNAVDKFYKGDYSEAIRMLNIVIQDCDGTVENSGGGAATANGSSCSSLFGSSGSGVFSSSATPTGSSGGLDSARRRTGAAPNSSSAGGGGGNGCGSLFAVYGNRAACYLNQGLYHHCLNDCQRALRIHPTHYASYARLIHCSIVMKRVGDARQYLKQLENLPRHGYKIEHFESLIEKLSLFLSFSAKMAGTTTTPPPEGDLVGGGSNKAAYSSSSSSSGTTSAKLAAAAQDGALSAISELITTIQEYQKDKVLEPVSAAGVVATTTMSSSSQHQKSAAAGGLSSLSTVAQDAFAQRSRNIVTPFALMRIECLASTACQLQQVEGGGSSSSSRFGYGRTSQDAALEEVNSLIRLLYGSAALAELNSNIFNGGSSGSSGGTTSLASSSSSSSASTKGSDYVDLLFWRAQLTYDRACEPKNLDGVQATLSRCLATASNSSIASSSSSSSNGNSTPSSLSATVSRATTLLRTVKSIETQWSNAMSYASTKRMKEAVNTWSQLLELDLLRNSKLAATFLQERAKCHLAGGNLQQALNDCNAAKETNSCDAAQTLGLRADVHRELGQLHYAVRDAEDSVKINPTPLAHERLVKYRQELMVRQRQQQTQRDEQRRKEEEQRAEEQRRQEKERADNAFRRHQQQQHKRSSTTGDQSDTTKDNYYDLSSDNEDAQEEEDPFCDANVFGTNKAKFKSSYSSSSGFSSARGPGSGDNGTSRPKRPQTAGSRRPDAESNKSSGSRKPSSSNTMGEGLYEVFALKRTASAAEIQRAYRKCALKWHPDRWVSASAPEQATAEETFKKMNHAYSVLSNEESRRRHDLSL